MQRELRRQFKVVRIKFGGYMSGIKLIAEIGMNHEGSVGQAKMLVKAAKESGADAVKFQMHISEEETLRCAPAPAYFTGESRYDYFERTAFTLDEWRSIREFCQEQEVEFIVSPFSIEAVRRLMQIGVDAIKIPSGEVTNTPYLEFISEHPVSVILSSGMNTWDEIQEAYTILNRKNTVSILQCTSEYPCKAEHLGLNIITDLQQKFPHATIGFSDHSDNIWSSILAVSFGAKIIERHFTLSKLMYGPDAYMSLEPAELLQLRKALDYTVQALGSQVDKNDISQYETMRITFQKSIVANEDILEGTIIREEMLAYKKPGSGIAAKRYKDLIGKRANKDIVKDTMIGEDDIEW